METPSWTAESALVFAFDVGTTQSAASVVHCHPGQVPAPRVIPRWPSSPNSSKIPTSILYDKNGLSVALGAEAKEETMLERVADGQLTEARWFKLHLHPAVMQPPPYSLETSAAAVAPVAGQGSFEVPALPKNVTAQKCFADFLRYLFTGSKNWYLENAPDGESIWNKLGASVKIVLAHPNGWGLEEQAVLKKAVVAAGIMDLAATEKRLLFVTEAEANVHFGLRHSATTATGWLKEGASFAVVAGGSTVDTRVYSVESVLPKLKLREAKTSDCPCAKGTIIETDKCHREPVVLNLTATDSLQFSLAVHTYKSAKVSSGINALDGWSNPAVGTPYDGFAQCYTFTADLTSLAAPQPCRTNPINGKAYKELSFSVGVFFGSTSLRAWLIWMENGIEKHGPASIVPSSLVRGGCGEGGSCF